MIGNDIRNQIKIHNERKQMYETEKEYLLKKMLQGPSGYKPINYDGMPHGNSDDTALEDRWEDLRRLQNMIDLEAWAIEALSKQDEEMTTNIKKLKGIDAQVKYMRDYEGKTLQQIADELKYELGYIKNVSARNPRKLI